MSQNVYEDSAFLERYWGLHGVTGHEPNSVPDLKTLASLLPPLRGARLLDLGCGDGWFCRWAATQDAADVHGVDRATSMLTRARDTMFLARDKMINGIRSANVRFSLADLNDPVGMFERLSDEAEEQELHVMGQAGKESRYYNLVFSGLAIHYTTDLRALFSEVHKALRPGGAFVFSVEHPMRTAAHRPSLMTCANADGTEYRCWPVADYGDESERVTNWLMEGVVKQHYTLETYLNRLWEAGFEVVDFREWGEKEEPDGRYRNEKWFIPKEVMPAYMLIGARKKTS